MSARILRGLVALLAAAQLGGCASLYFDDAGAPPSPPPQYDLKNWPYREYWTGIVFNGNKIGFSRLSITPARDGAGLYEIRSESTFLLKFLGIEKQFQLTSLDRVRDDLTLVEFAHDYTMDGNKLKLTGAVAGDSMQVAIVTGGNRSEQQIPLAGPLYPTSIIPLYPLRHGLETGRRYVYQVYDGQTQTLAQIEQDIQGYERSKLFAGNAFKIKTTMLGHASTMWMNELGKPVFELALNGVLISALESEHEAKRYLALASLNKKDVMLDFSLVRVDAPIREPRRATTMKIALEGLDGAALPPPDAGQRCEVAGGALLCDIRTLRPPSVSAPNAPNGDAKYLRPSITVPSYDPRIRAQAREIAGTEAPPAAVARLVDWMQKNIERSPVDVFSALDVLDGRKAECQGHAYLYAAFARALAIPTRVVNGLVYSEEHQGFLYHSWNESLIGDVWLPVDPTFGQVGADATHIKLIEGEAAADLLPLVEVVGKIRARVISSSAP